MASSRKPMRNGKPFRTPKPRPWSECWYVQLEWMGNKVQVLPLLEFILGRNSDHSGSFMVGPPLCDAMWDRMSAPAARIVYDKLADLIKGCRWWWGYVRLRLLHDWQEGKPPKCEWQLKRGKAPSFPEPKRPKSAPRKKAA